MWGDNAQPFRSADTAAPPPILGCTPPHGSPAREPRPFVERAGSGRGAGFTIIELALVSVVLLILLAASIPRFAETAQRLRLERTAFELTQLLRVAHERAVAQGQPMLWVWDDETRSAHLEAVVEGAPVRLEERMAHSEPLMAGATLELLRDARPVACRCVNFLPDGTSEPTTIALAFGASRYTVTVHEATAQACLAAGTAAC